MKGFKMQIQSTDDMSETREKFPLNKKKIIKRTIARVWRWLIILIFFSPIIFVFRVANNKNSLNINEIFTNFNSSLIVSLILVFLFLVAIIGYFYEKWYFKVYFYNLSNDFVIIRKNPITPREIILPYNRIQDIGIGQDLLDRFFGLYNVSLSSATSSSATEAYISGLEKANAEGLRNELLNKVKEKTNKN